MLSMWANKTLLTWKANISTIHVVTSRDKDKIFIRTSSTIFLANTRKFRIGQNMNNILLIQCTLILHRYGYIWWCNKWTVLHQYGANSNRKQNSQEKLQQQAYNCLTQWNFVIIYVSLVLQYFRLHHVLIVMRIWTREIE